MYKCETCGNTEDFQEYNLVKTILRNGEKIDEKFIECEDVECVKCRSKYSEGLIVRVESELPTLHTKIMTEITSYCENECGNCRYCKENDCALYRIEQIVLEDS